MYYLPLQVLPEAVSEVPCGWETRPELFTTFLADQHDKQHLEIKCGRWK